MLLVCCRRCCVAVVPPHHAAYFAHTIECAYMVKVVYNIPKSIVELVVVRDGDGAASNRRKELLAFLLLLLLPIKAHFDQQSCE